MDKKKIEQMGGDHDLLIRIDSMVQTLIRDVKELKDNTIARVEELERNKMDKEEGNRLLAESTALYEDHERRIRKLEKWGFIALGALMLFEFISRFVTLK